MFELILEGYKLYKTAIYISRHATSKVTDTLFYSDNMTLLDEKKPLFGQDNVMPCLKPH